MMQTLKLGSLYLDEQPVTLGPEYRPGQTISFGEATPDKTISWVPVNGLLIADRCLLTMISWDDINAQGLVFGREIELYGFRFRARLLKVGNDKDVPNEWDDALDVVGDSDNLWHWDDMFFWGQDITAVDASLRADRGYLSARSWNCYISSYRNSHLGFRPALVPLPTDASALRRGQEIMAIGRDGCVVGNLADETQYDLIIRTKAGGVTGVSSFVANIQDGTLAVDRSGIFGIATT